MERRLDRRAVIAGGIAAITAGALPAAAGGFPAVLDWRMRVGPVNVPFLLDGTPGDLPTFRDQMHKALRTTLLSDVPQILYEARDRGLDDYMRSARAAASRIEAASRRTMQAPTAPSISDATRRRAYVTIAASACLLRWKSATIAPSLSAMSNAPARVGDQSVFPYQAENLGLSYGDAIAAMAIPGSPRPSSLTALRPAQAWEIAFVSLQMEHVFQGFRGKPSEDIARHLQFAGDYAADVTDPAGMTPIDHDQRAADVYADALLLTSAQSYWQALVRT